jgi:hypothetical protein
LVIAGARLAMDQVNEVDPELAGVALSVAVTVTVATPAVVGVPLIVPVEGLMERPAGSPVADQVRTGVGEVWESVAEGVSGVTARPVPPDCAAMALTVTVFRIVQLKVVWAEYPAPSVAVTVTAVTCPVVGFPEITPVEDLIDSPAGSPLAV